jgi:hypothetical protein
MVSCFCVVRDDGGARDMSRETIAACDANGDARDVHGIYGVTGASHVTVMVFEVHVTGGGTVDR